MRQQKNFKHIIDEYNVWFKDMGVAYKQDLDNIVKQRVDLYSKSNFTVSGQGDGFNSRQSFHDHTNTMMADCTRAYVNNILTIKNKYLNAVENEIATPNPLIKGPLINRINEKADVLINASADVRRSTMLDYTSATSKLLNTNNSNLFNTSCPLEKSDYLLYNLLDITCITYAILFIFCVALLVAVYKKYNKKYKK